MDIFPVVPGMTLELGKTGTHYVRAFRFDISAWQEAYPDGIINLIHRMPDANEPYVAGYLRLGEGYIDWVVQSSDVAVPGYGECELVMIVDGVAVDKTDTYPTHIEEQLGTNSVTPPTGATWVEQVLTVGNATLQAVEGFEDLVDEKEQEITGLASGKEQNITDLATQKIAAIEAKGAETLDSIPEDYTELSGDVTELKRAFEGEIGKLANQIFLSDTLSYLNLKAGTLLKDKYWGNGGLLDVTAPDGVYYAYQSLHIVKPGEYLILENYSLINNLTSALIGMYDDSGANAPGRVNINNTDIVKSYKINENILEYAIIQIPENCTRVGFFVKASTDATTADLIDFSPVVVYAGAVNDELNSLAEFEKNDFKTISLSELTENKYWGNGGLITAPPDGNGYYMALSELVSVNPGDHVILRDFYTAQHSGAAFIGMYDNDGNNAPGRVNYNSQYVLSLTIQQNTVRLAEIVIPDGCTQIGLFFKHYPPDVPLTECISAYKVKAGNYSFEFTDQAKEKIKEIVVESVNDLEIDAVDIKSDYYIKGEAPKLERTKKLCIIGAGQSNIDGRVPVSELPNYITLPMPGMYYEKNSLTGEFVNNYPSVTNWGFDLITAYHIIQTIGANNLYYIKWSQGGTSIDSTGDNTAHWTPDYENLTPEKALILQFNKEILKSIEEHPDVFQIGAMIWHQGEGDRGSYSPTAANNYYNNLKKVIAFCRGIAKNDCLPFILGTISQNSSQYDSIVDSAIRKIATEDEYVYLVDMKNAVLRDAFHFNAAWSVYFGEKVFDALIDAGVITGTKINPSEPS